MPTDSLTAPTTPVSNSSIDLPDSCIGLYREEARDMVVVVGGGGGVLIFAIARQRKYDFYHVPPPPSPTTTN